MTDTTLKLTEAFNRHNSLHNALLGNMKTLTTSHAEEITITLDARHARALTRILNAAPLNGDPLNTRVNVETDTDAWETDASKINRYLEDNDWEPTLENVSAAFLYTETEPPHLDIELHGKEYRVTRIHAVEQYTGDGGGRGGGYTKIITSAPGWDEYPNFDFYGTEPENVEGEEHKAANARAIRYYNPDRIASLGGILMEHIAD
nr:MAG TPA: hypothetical protein [Caudoviricetes sp.]